MSCLSGRWTLEDRPAPAKRKLNDLAVVSYDWPTAHRRSERDRTGAFILIDEATNDTVAAGMVLEAG